MFTLFWFTFLIFSVSCYGRLFLQLHQCLYIINIHLLYQYWCHDLFFKYLRVHFIQWNHSFVSLINSIVLEEGPFSSPGARWARSLPCAVCFYTNINYFVIFCDFLRILFSRYIYCLLEGLIIITDCWMFVR